MTKEQKALLAYEIMDAAVNRIVTNNENDLWPDELKTLSPEEISQQIAKWLDRLPGHLWHTSLPSRSDES